MKGTGMDCQRAAELLPWLMNGTLQEDERRELEDHLKECPTCQAEAAETAFAGRVFRQHIPVEALVAYASGGPPEGLDRDLLEEHLAGCDDCAEELALVQESLGLAEEGAAPVVPLPTRRRAVSPFWQHAALAASLVGLVALGGWLWSLQEQRALEATLAARQEAMERERREAEAALQDRLARLEEEREGLAQQAEELASRLEETRQEIPRLQEEIAALATPRANPWITDLFPQEMVLRGGREPAPQEVPSGVPLAVLILHPEDPGDRTPYAAYELEVLDPEGRRLWRTREIERQPQGDFTVALPTTWLPQGRLSLRLYGVSDKGERSLLGSYGLMNP